jgi:predicted Zn-dependent protease
MRSFLWLLATLVLQAQPDPGRGVNFYSLEKEKALGEQIAKDYRRTAQPVDNPELQSWIETLGKSLVPAGSKYAYRFELVEAPDTLLHEPASFPGGIVFVPTQLILAVENEDELAGMIAHAMAHIEARHGTKQATKAEIVNQASIPLIYMGGWSGNAMRPGIAMPLQFVQFHRTLDLQADTLAAALMSAAGYDPAALVRYIERVQPAEPQPPAMSWPLPEKSARLDALRALPPGGPYPPHPPVAAKQELLPRPSPEKPKTPPTLIRKQ